MAIMFKKLLEQYRIKSGLNKTEVARRVEISPTYYMQLEAGVRGAPPLSRCRLIASAMRLDKEETESLIKSASSERVGHTKEEELSIIQSGGHRTQPPAETKKVVIRITSRGNAEIVSKDPGVSVAIQYDDDEEGVVVPMTKHKIEPVRTDKNRINKHAHHAT